MPRLGTLPDSSQSVLTNQNDIRAPPVHFRSITLILVSM